MSIIESYLRKTIYLTINRRILKKEKQIIDILEFE